MCQKGFEPLTLALEGRCSIQLSYRHIHIMVRMKGLEPPSLAALDPKSSVSANFTTSALTELPLPHPYVIKFGAGDGATRHANNPVNCL